MGYYLEGYGFNFSRNKATKILFQLQANIFLFNIFVILRISITVILQVRVAITQTILTYFKNVTPINVITHILLSKQQENLSYVSYPLQSYRNWQQSL